MLRNIPPLASNSNSQNNAEQKTKTKKTIGNFFHQHQWCSKSFRSLTNQQFTDLHVQFDDLSIATLEEWISLLNRIAFLGRRPRWCLLRNEITDITTTNISKSLPVSSFTPTSTATSINLISPALSLLAIDNTPKFTLNFNGLPSPGFVQRPHSLSHKPSPAIETQSCNTPVQLEGLQPAAEEDTEQPTSPDYIPSPKAAVDPNQHFVLAHRYIAKEGFVDSESQIGLTKLILEPEVTASLVTPLPLVIPEQLTPTNSPMASLDCVDCKNQIWSKDVDWLLACFCTPMIFKLLKAYAQQKLSTLRQFFHHSTAKSSCVFNLNTNNQQIECMFQWQCNIFNGNIRIDANNPSITSPIQKVCLRFALDLLRDNSSNTFRLTVND